MKHSRIKHIFKNGKAYVGYLTMCDGGIENTLQYASALIEGGVNILELGIPFSDPIADGPIIQRAAQRALQQGINAKEILWLIEQLRKLTEVPLILFSYLNPILAMQKDNFLSRAKTAGIDGLLVVDCPLEESQNIYDICTQAQLAPIYVIAPTTSAARLKKINQYGEGFLYYACRKGTTGLQDEMPQDFVNKIQEIKSIVNLPVVVGFGISNANTAQQVLQHADGVVVGSRFVKAVEEKVPIEGLTKLAQGLLGCHSERSEESPTEST